MTTKTNAKHFYIFSIHIHSDDYYFRLCTFTETKKGAKHFYTRLEKQFSHVHDFYHMNLMTFIEIYACANEMIHTI